MKCNAWTLALAGAGLVSLPAVVCGEEKPSSVLTSLASTTISGYVDTSAQWNAGTGNANTPPYAFGGPGKADGFNLNVVKLTLEKPIDTNRRLGCRIQGGSAFRPGRQCAGHPVLRHGGRLRRQTSLRRLACARGQRPGFSRSGVWDTIIGYEVTDSVNNPNFTRSYGYTIEPPTHTGIQAAYQFSETLSAVFGVADTFGPKINERAFPARAESYKTYLGSLTLTAPKSWGALAGSTLSGCVINGFNSGASAGRRRSDQLVCGRHAQHPAERLESGRCLRLCRCEQSASERQQLRQCCRGLCLVSGHGKAQPACARRIRLQRCPDFGGDPRYWARAGSFAATGTLQYDLWKNVLSRIEFRWDHAADGSEAYGGTPVAGSTAPVPGTKKNSYILLANCSYKF